MMVHLVFEGSREVTEFNECIDSEKLMSAYKTSNGAQKEVDRLVKTLDEDDIEDTWYEIKTIRVRN